MLQSAGAWWQLELAEPASNPVGLVTLTMPRGRISDKRPGSDQFSNGNTLDCRRWWLLAGCSTQEPMGYFGQPGGSKGAVVTVSNTSCTDAAGCLSDDDTHVCGVLDYYEAGRQRAFAWL